MTIEIAVNFNTIHTVSAVNITKDFEQTVHTYAVFEGLSRIHAKLIRQLEHVRAEGASVLAAKMLLTFPSPTFSGHQHRSIEAE